MYEVWLAASGFEGPVLLRADRIVEIHVMGTQLSVRAVDDIDQCFNVVAGCPPSSGLALQLELIGALERARDLAEHYMQPHLVAALREEDRLVWLIDRVEQHVEQLRIWPGSRIQAPSPIPPRPPAPTSQTPWGSHIGPGNPSPRGGRCHYTT